MNEKDFLIICFHADTQPNTLKLMCCPLLFLVSSTDLKKVKAMVDNLLIEKQKMEKGKKNKGKGKAKLKIRDDNSLLSEYDGYVYDDYDDFM